MPYTARALITKAYYLSGIVAREFQSVSGAQFADGLDFLNEVLAEDSMIGSLIPYFKEYTLNAVPGQEIYFIPGLIKAEVLTFNIGDVRYSTRPLRRKRYQGSSRVDNIQSLPYTWYTERKLNGADIYLYFLPNSDYPLKIWGKFKLDEITDLCADMLLVYDRFYLKYLAHALAAEICNENLIPIPPQTAQSLARLTKKLTKVSPRDLTMQKITSFSRQPYINYAMVNLWAGWYPI